MRCLVGSIPIRSRFEMDRIYFDYNATMPLAQEATRAIQPFLERESGAELRETAG